MDVDRYYTVSEAAKVLGKGERWVRRLAQEEEIEAVRAESGWKLARHSVHDYRDRQRTQEKPQETPQWPVEAREALDEVKDLRYQLGRLEGRLELTEKAESTLVEQLERERQRADQERERAEQERLERQSVQEEAKEQRVALEEENLRLREVLQTERSKGFWRRLFDLLATL